MNQLPDDTVGIAHADNTRDHPALGTQKQETSE